VEIATVALLWVIVAWRIGELAIADWRIVRPNLRRALAISSPAVRRSAASGNSVTAETGLCVVHVQFAGGI
jgi:hypothetical protein